MVVLLASGVRAQGVFVRGDCDQNDDLDITDAIALLGFLFVDGEDLICEDACDSDDSGELDITDAVFVLAYQFLGRNPPLPPFPLPGLDETADLLSCLNGQLPFEEIRVSPDHVVLHYVEEKVRLSVNGYSEERGLVDVSTHRATLYSSDDPSIAGVGSGALVTARGVGTTVIRVLHSGAAGSARVTVAAGADGSPIIKIGSPTQGSIVTSSSVRVSGLVTDPAATLSLQRNDDPATEIDNDSGRFASVVDLEPGDNRVTVTAANDGGSGEMSVDVRRVEAGSSEAIGPDGRALPAAIIPWVDVSDDVAPSIEITRPTNGATLRSGLVTVEGRIDDPDAEVRVEGRVASVENGTFRVERLRLPAGTSTITARAVDAVGNDSRHSVDIDVEGLFSRIVFLGPPPASEGSDIHVATSSTFELRGRVEGRVSRVTINGQEALLTGDMFRLMTTLADGIHDLVVTARDGSEPPVLSQAVFSVLVDTDGPQLELLHPPLAIAGSARGLETSEETLRIVGRVRDLGVPLDLAEEITVVVGDRTPVLVRDSFAVEVPLEIGVNLIPVRATDVRGQSTTTEIRAVRSDFAIDRFIIGDAQSTSVGEFYPGPLRVQALTAFGSPRQNLGVEFRFLVGSGVFENGTRRTVIRTGVDGVARVEVRAGHEIGERSQVIAVGIPGDDTPRSILVLDSTPSGSTQLVALRGRRRVGAAESTALEPLGARLLDRYGDPLAGRTVVYRVVEGGARLGPRDSTELDVISDGSGRAIVDARLPPGSSLSRVEASFEESRVEFVLRGVESGAPLDTRIDGAVIDQRGVAVVGVAVRIADVEGVSTTTGPRGDFSLVGTPGGRVCLEVEATSDHSGTRRTIAVVAGAHRVLEDAIRVARFDDPSRTRSQLLGISRGGTFTLTALPGMRLHVDAGAAIFPDGSRDGVLRVSFPSGRIVGGIAPDDVDVRIPLLISPPGVRFDPPARLVLPSPGLEAGRTVALYSSDGNTGFRRAAVARVSDDGVNVAVSELDGVRSAGLSFVELPGASGGQTGRLDGEVRVGLPGLVETPQRAASAVVGHDVYAHSGELFLDAEDLTVRGRGLSYRLRRRYESRNNFRGSLGWNWEHEYTDRRLFHAPASGNIVRVDGRGGRHEFLLDRSTGRFVSPVGVFSRLFEDSEGYLVERTPDGIRYRHAPLDGRPSGGRLVSIGDRAGNELEMELDAEGRLEAVVDTLARRVEYEWDAEGRVERVVDYTGRRVLFEYSESGDLVAVTGPAVTGTPNGNDFPAGRRTEYIYSSGFEDRRLDHNLVAWIEPREVASGSRVSRLTNRYDEDPLSPSVDRVVEQVIGGENAAGIGAVGTVTFEYSDRSAWAPGASIEPSELAAFLLSEATLTTVLDAHGVTTEIVSSGAGLPVSKRTHTLDDGRPRVVGTLHPPPGVRPPWYETRYRWSREGLLTMLTHPRGNGVEYEYDVDAPLRYSRANRIRESRFPARGADGSEETLLVTECVHDPIFQRVVVETPPGPDGAADPTRSIRRTLDYQESASIESLAAATGVDGPDIAEAFQHAGLVVGLGDVNGDGATQRRSGDIVLEELSATGGKATATRREFVYNFFSQLVERRDGEGVMTRYEYYSERDPEGDGIETSVDGLDRDTGGFLRRRVVDPQGHGNADPLTVAESFTYDAYGHLATRVGARGFETTYIHNQLGELVERGVPAPLRYRRQWFYDADGNVIEVRDANLRANDAGTHLIVSENLWVETYFEYDLLGQVLSVEREVSGGDVGPARSVTTGLRYDIDGRLVRIIRPVEGTDEVREYDERGLEIVRVVAPGSADEARTETLRDENGNIVLSIDAADSDLDGSRESTERRHDGHDRLVAIIDPAGGARILTRDGTSRVVAESFLGAPGGPTPVVGEPGAADTTGNVLLSRTAFVFDERGQLRERRRSLFGAEGSPSRVLVESFEYDAEGRVVRESGPDGIVRTIVLDALGRPVEESDTVGNRVTRRFDVAGNLLREQRESVSQEIIDPDAPEDSDYADDGRLRLVESEVHAYDMLDRVIVSVDTAGGTWRVRYDSASRPILISDSSAVPTGAPATSDLDEIADLLTEQQRDRINGHGNRRRFLYDGLGRVITAECEMRADGTGDSPLESTNGFNVDGIVRETYTWDGNGRLVEWYDDLGRRTRLEWDRAGYLRRKTWNDGSTDAWDVDRDGNPTRHVDRNGTAIRQSFDTLDRLIRREIVPGEDIVDNGGTTMQLFEYDGLGRTTLAVDGNDPTNPNDHSTVLRRYDSLGRLVSECQGRFGYSFGYDEVGRLISESYPGGRIVERIRGPGGAQSELRDASGSTFVAYTRFRNGRVIDRLLPGGSFLSFLESDPEGVVRLSGYDERGGVVRLDHVGAEGEFYFSFEYGRNQRGDPKWSRGLHRDGRGDVWEYDSLYRLRAFYPEVFDPRVPPQNPVRRSVYLIDGNHNWRQIDVDQSVQSITVDELDRYRFFGADVLTHGATGNIEQIADEEYVFDGLDRLIRVERQGKVVARYRYDAAGCEDAWLARGRGRRVTKEVLIPGRDQPPGRLLYTYARDGVGEERAANGDLERLYFWEDGARPAVVLTRSESTSDVVQYFLHDPEGSTLGLIDASGALRTTAAYGPHGELRLRNHFHSRVDYPESGNAFFFGSNLIDFESGLLVDGARYFSATLGRFLTRVDPIVPQQPFALNGYVRPGVRGLPGAVMGGSEWRLSEAFESRFRVTLDAPGVQHESIPKTPGPQESLVSDGVTQGGRR